MKLTIQGSVPSLKNNKQIAYNPKTGRTFITSSKASKLWVTEALWQLKGQPKATKPVSVQMVFHVKDNRSRDLDNMCSSVLDVLQEAGAIVNDDWQHCNPVVLSVAGIDKENPKVEIYLTEDAA